MLNVVPALCYIIITTTLRCGSFTVCSPFAPLGPFSTFYYPILCPVSNLYRCHHQVPVPSGLRQVPRVGWKWSLGIYSPISVSWGPELAFSLSPQLLVTAPFWKPPHSLKLPVIAPLLVTSDMGVTLLYPWRFTFPCWVLLLLPTLLSLVPH